MWTSCQERLVAAYITHICEVSRRRHEQLLITWVITKTMSVAKAWDKKNDFLGRLSNITNRAILPRAKISICEKMAEVRFALFLFHANEHPAYPSS